MKEISKQVIGFIKGIVRVQKLWKMNIRIIGLTCLITGMTVPLLSAQQYKKQSEELLTSYGLSDTQNSAAARDLQQVIELKLDHASVEQALITIADKADLKLMYSESLLPKEATITIAEQSVTLNDALWNVLKGTGLRFALSENHQLVLLNKQVRSLQAVQEPITGQVTDAQSGETLPGVNILVKGTSTGASTDADGQYNLTVESLQDTLVVSFVGYKTQQVPIRGRTEINIALQSQAITGEEMVVVGYGTQEQVNLTGSVSSVDYDEDLGNRPITNPSQALSGKTSGVWVSQNSGKPGSDGAQIRIRGWGTMNNADPLIIVDGVQGSFDQVNPQNIKSISVLKDAASAAIYGSRAANGVVLITTKEGGYNKEMQINVSSYGGVQKLGRRYDMIDNSVEFMELYNQALMNGGSSPLYPDYLISEFKNSSNPYKYPNTNWYKELFRTAPIQNHNVSISGGSKQISAFMSLNYLNQKGIVKNTNSEKYGVRVNLRSRPVKWLTIGAKLRYKKQQSNEPYRLFRTWSNLSWTVPFIAPYTKEGRFGSVQAIDKDGNLLYDNRNPLIDNNNGDTETDQQLINASINSEIKFTNNLNLKTTFSSNNSQQLTSRWNQSLYGYTSTGKKTQTLNFNREGIERIRENIGTQEISLYNVLNYQKQFGRIHDFSALAGMEYQSRTIKNVRARRMNPPKESLTQVNAGTSDYQANGNLLGVRTLSYFARLNYSLSDKYLFEIDFRRDGSSRFQKGKRWGTFPGASVGWRLSEEKFIQNLDVFSSLKLRASWGKLGNQNIAGYWPYLTTIAQNNNLSYSYNQNFEAGAAVTSLTDPYVTWETAIQKDIGINAGFLNNRLKIEANYFNKVTKDIIVQLPIPRTLGGVSSPNENEGRMVNNGAELAINYDFLAQQGDNLGASMKANVTYTHNEVTKFRGGNSPDQLYLIREGYSFKSLYGYHVVGIYESDAAAAKHMYANSYTPKAGNLKYEDVNNDGKLGFEDKQVLGNTIPKWTFGLSPKFNFKGFDLTMLFQGSADFSVNTKNAYLTIASNIQSMSTMWRNAWTPQNTDTNIPSIKVNNAWDQRNSDFWIADISYVKLRNIQLGYTVPANISSRLGIQELYVYANGDNVFTIVSDDYHGYNPERSTFTSGEGIYPTPKIYTIGFNIKF